MTDDRMAAASAPGPEDPEDAAGAGIDTTVPHSARIWNYWLGGKDNYAVDREAGDQYVKVFPRHRRRRPCWPGLPGPGRALPGA
jgi:hypothetical protein